jgi:hypothetical protein
VEPYVELSRVEYLRIVDYGLASGLPKPVAGVPRSVRRVTPAPPIVGTNHH